MPKDGDPVEDRLTILPDRVADRNVFSLEMGPDGVRLRLGAAVLGDWLVLKELVLRVPHVPRSFDYTAGPRSLQSALTRLEGVVVELRLDGLTSRIRDVPGIEVAGIRAQGGRLSVSGTVDQAPFTLRLIPEASGPTDVPADLSVRFEEPRIYGWIGRAWDRLGPALASALPSALRVAVERDRVLLSVLRPVLMPLLAGMGCKVPLVDGVILSSVRAEDNRLILRFEAADAQAARPALDDDCRVPESPENEARAALRVLEQGFDPKAGTRLLENGVVVPRLWPEVLFTARALGEDRPEWVLPHLVGVLLAARMPEIVSWKDVAVLARRLLASVEATGDPADLALAGRLVATIAFDLDPREALDLLDAVRVRGVSDPAVLEAAALALDRLGRGAEARSVRARLLALAPAGCTAEVLRSVVDRLDRAGLGSVASAWLDETIVLSEEDRFGSEGPSIRRQALLLSAARTSLAGDARGRLLLLDLLRQNAGDREALDLLLVTARTDREAAEVIARLRDAAAGTSGAPRAAFLRDAARATVDRLGLRRQAVELLEAALEADPLDIEAADALDRLCADLGMEDRRLALALARLSWTTDPEARVEALLRVARLAEKTGDINEAARCVSEVLAGDPTNREALETGIRVFASSGDESALVRAWDTLLDVDARAT